jgi:hypothetical protein
MAFDGELSDFKSTAEKDPSAVFDDESLFENLEAANDNNEREFSLDSAEAIQSLLTYVEDTALDNWLDEHPGDGNGFSDSESFQLLTELQHEAKILEKKIETGEVSEVDAVAIQALIDKFQASESPEDVSENFAESELFDPNSYIHDQFAGHPYLIPSQRSPVYLLQREYKRALSEGVSGDAEILAQQIKDHVDELVGNDLLAEEGVGTDLTMKKKSAPLVLKNLDPEPQEDEPKFRFDDNIPVVLEEPEPAEEVQLQTLYGMQLPTVEQKNTFSAASFREGLQIAMRHDADLQQMPDKQELFNELLNLLKYIPENGVSTEVASELQDLAEKINDSEVVVSETAKSISASFTPNAIKEHISTRDLKQEQGRQEREIQKEIETIEASANQNFLSRFVNRDKSPYEKLANNDFETVVMDTDPQFVNSFQRAAFIRDKQIDQTAFDRWMNLFSQLEDSGIETAGKTFKEVADQLVELQITERNTQST